ncbi:MULTISPECIES: hypothetical protein [Mediterranea]|uniref:fimbrial tip adhesin FimD n=1 Tax=Mediterranea TaxID=1926659 RepID=UPI0020114055|nr:MULTISPECIES: hypothetical protein [Mediterranea]MCL1608699.1 hypothetical protein [Mediterranea sp. ET5]MDM8123664.1 hypothetical protein [Mediterranea massiliensis]MDM8199467.1 hypothetical protein [Mediterranea massiliensis]
MKRTILNGLLLLGALLVGGACQNEMELGAPVLDADSFNIVTRAEGDVPEGTIAGDDAYNENTVQNARVYFFPANQAETETSVYECTVSAAADGKTLPVKVESYMYDKSYDIYVVANAPEDVNWPDGHAKLADLKALQMVTAWKEGGEEALLMDGVLPNQQVVRGGSATVDLTRAMAKVTLKVTAAEKITDGDVTYTPDFAHMSVTLVNAATKTQLDGNYRPTGGDYTGVTQEYEANEEGAYVHAPLYSYPNPEAGATGERQNAYLQLRLPWLMKDGTGQQAGNYYYTIPITANHVANMERNHYYDVSVDVKVLGSLDPNDMVELTPNIFIRDWFNMQLSSSIDKFQYLVLEEDSTTLYNVTDYANPYVSSSEIESVNILSVKYVDYSKEEFSEYTLTESDQYGPEVNGRRDSWNNYDAWKAEDKTITFNHAINTDIMYAKRVITIEVTNKEGISRTWVITQYPEMYIEGENNKARGGYNRFVYGERATSDNGNVSVNNDNWNSSLGGVYGYDYGGTNNNPNQYTIYVTANSPYAIGDPRSSTSVSAASLNISQKEDYTGNTLKTYYPTRGREVANMIAPAFKIASSWGKTLNISFARAKERCASYQENGYPAGRWRVPTEAEIAYVISLSEDKKIPKLFDEGYWCSSGTVYGSSGDEAAAVRCVYDVWYWGEGKEGDAANNYERFYWGSQTPSSN